MSVLKVAVGDSTGVCVLHTLHSWMAICNHVAVAPLIEKSVLPSNKSTFPPNRMSYIRFRTRSERMKNFDHISSPALERGILCRAGGGLARTKAPGREMNLVRILFSLASLICRYLQLQISTYAEKCIQTASLQRCLSRPYARPWTLRTAIAGR